jgi:hypothetical protein
VWRCFSRKDRQEISVQEKTYLINPHFSVMVADFHTALIGENVAPFFSYLPSMILFVAVFRFLG